MTAGIVIKHFSGGIHPLELSESREITDHMMSPPFFLASKSTSLFPFRFLPFPHYSLTIMQEHMTKYLVPNEVRVRKLTSVCWASVCFLKLDSHNANKKLSTDLCLLEDSPTTMAGGMNIDACSCSMGVIFRA